MWKVRVFRDGYAVSCPGCGEEHQLGKSWSFNGDLESPTFSPSLLVRSGCHVPNHKPGDNCWCTYNASRPPEKKSSFSCKTCHSFITDGKIQFLSDCTHALAGQTVDLPNVEIDKVI